MERRSFLQTVTTTVGTGTMAGMGTGKVVGQEATSKSASPKESLTAVDRMPRRRLGRTPLCVSIVTFPGLALMRHGESEAAGILEDSFERGVNYFDVAPAYGNEGECEIKMGVGLQGLSRDDYVLSCKTKRRDKKGAREELERSLDRLKTDHFDLYQLHCLVKPQEVVEALEPGGAMETILEAKKEGKIRHIGFSAHTTKSAMRALRHFDFDTIMFPINFAEYYTIGMGKKVLDLAKQRGTAVLGMKTLSYGRWPKDVERTRKWWYRTVESDAHVRASLEFTLGFEGVVTAVPPSWLDLWDKTIEQAKVLSPHSDALLWRMKELAKGCESVFHPMEQSVADNQAEPGVYYVDSPHEMPPCMLG